jgi:hypothetical protein
LVHLVRKWERAKTDKSEMMRIRRDGIALEQTALICLEHWHLAQWVLREELWLLVIVLEHFEIGYLDCHIAVLRRDQRLESAEIARECVQLKSHYGVASHSP